MSLLLVSSSLGEGKDTFFELFNKHSKVQYCNKKFAYKLKQIIALLTSCTVEDLEKEEFKNSYLSEIWDTPVFDVEGKIIDWKKWTYREVLQYFGTDLLRDKFHPNVHINAFYSDYKKLPKATYKTGKYARQCISCTNWSHGCNKRQFLCQKCVEEWNSTSKYPNWIVTDCRFPNEFDSGKIFDAITIKVIRYMSPIQWLNSKYFSEIKFLPETRSKVLGSTDVKDKISKYHFVEYISPFVIDPVNDKNWTKLIHHSEVGLIDYYNQEKFDYVLHNDGTLEQFEEKVKKLVQTLQA